MFRRDCVLILFLREACVINEEAKFASLHVGLEFTSLRAGQGRGSVVRKRPDEGWSKNIGCQETEHDFLFM
jgi:hypothetical protein